MLICCAPAAARQQSGPLAPIELPRPTGRHAVGTFSLTFSDSSRREIFTANPDDIRRLPVQVYYPARKGCAPAPYFPPSLAQVYSSSMGLAPGFETAIRAHACRNAPVAKGSERFPLILFSHGLGHSHFSYVSLLEDLASRGNIVVAVDHSYSAQATYFTDRPLAAYDNHKWKRSADPASSRPATIEYYRLWAEDARRLLDRVAAEDRPLLGRSLTDRIDLDRIVYFGHSYGGLSAIYAAQHDRRIKGAVNLDGGVGIPASQPTSPPTMLLPVTADVPILTLNAIATLKPGFYGEGVRVVPVPGANHMTFSDYVWLIDKAGQSEARAGIKDAQVTPEEGIRMTRDVLALFLDCAFQRRCSELDARLATIRAPAARP